MRALPGVEAAGAIDDLPLQRRIRAADRSRGPRRAAAARSADRGSAQDHARLSAHDADSARCAGATSRDSDVEVLLVSQRRREAAVGRRRSDRPPRHAAAQSQDDLKASRRHRRRREAGRARRGRGPDGLRATRSERDWRSLDARPAHVGAARHAAQRRPRPSFAPSTRSSRSKTSGRWSDVLDETLTLAALQRAAARPLRGGRADARIGRHLQRAVLHRPRPQPRDRDPHRARRADRRRVRLVVVEGMTPALIGIAAGAVAALGVGEDPGEGSCSA